MTATETRPKLRTDLVVSRQDTPEGPCFVLKDPLTRRFFRLKAAEYAVARRLDGVSPLDAVARQAGAELGVDATAEALAPFVEQLRRRGLLAGADGVAPSAGRSVFQGNLLWLRLKAFDPDRLFDRLVGKVGFCFTPRFVIASGVLIGWAAVTTVLNHREIAGDLARLWSFESLFFAWVTMLTVTTLHEFAHGLTCKRFGGQVHEIGFLLIYLQPAFYCNISDAWLFPQKSKRLWVTFAGGFFELVIWALAVFLWRVAERGTWISGAALVVMATSGIKQVFNLNPLIKLDGYYLLSDWLDVPNLRQRAFGYVGACLRRLLWGRAAVPELPPATPRERRIFLAYGVIAAAFSYWLLGSLLLAVSGFFTESYQAWGFGLSTALAAAVFGGVTGKPVFAWVPRLWRPGRRGQLLILAGAALVLLHLVRLPLRVSGEFEVLPAANADVRAQVEGIVEEVHVREGDPVAAGQPIARLSDRQALARLRMVEAEIGEKRARLALLRAGARREEIEVARLAVAKAEERLRFARAELQRVQALAAVEAASRTELDQAEERVAVQVKDRDEARARLQALAAGSRPQEIAALEQEILRSEADRQRLEGDLQRLVVVAPHAGVVVTPRLHEKVGAFVRAGDLVAEVHAIETVRAEIAVPERDIGDVRVGQRGDLRLRAYPGRTFTGRVTAIAPAADSGLALGGRTVRVTIAIPNPDGVLKPQLTGYARIFGGERRALDLLTRRVRRFLRVEFWSWW
ncbi:MAG TPA: efflux RND transporter periplasmic adaptor subunit [Gemmatimonadales bacterium]|nr:efflux RND transporter periplasmic adaptor subunit [Gemmatimonadales bacterium]